MINASFEHSTPICSGHNQSQTEGFNIEVHWFDLEIIYKASNISSEIIRNWTASIATVAPGSTAIPGATSLRWITSLPVLLYILLVIPSLNSKV